MYKVRIIVDWIVYLTFIIILSLVLASGYYYISQIAEYGVRPPINIVFIMGYALARIIFAPILLMLFTIGRLKKKNMRTNTIILK